MKPISTNPDFQTDGARRRGKHGSTPATFMLAPPQEPSHNNNSIHVEEKKHDLQSMGE